MKVPPILISACLLGEKVRYDGRNNQQVNQLLTQMLSKKLLVPLCPEVSGGLPVPRPPAEIILNEQGDKIILDINGRDVTKEFDLGAEKALQHCLKNKIKVAILKENSPSCGSGFVYDGSFSSTKVVGTGVTTRLLRQNGIMVYNEHQIDDAVKYHSNLFGLK